MANDTRELQLSFLAQASGDWKFTKNLNAANGLYSLLDASGAVVLDGAVPLDDVSLSQILCFLNSCP